MSSPSLSLLVADISNLLTVMNLTVLTVLALCRFKVASPADPEWQHGEVPAVEKSGDGPLEESEEALT